LPLAPLCSTVTALAILGDVIIIILCYDNEIDSLPFPASIANVCL
jgi:hypothetical protein